MTIVSCLDCNEDKKHRAKGLCDRCYLRRYRVENSLRIAELKRQWRARDVARTKLKAKLQREKVHFDGKRDVILARDGYRCVTCNTASDLVVHHRDGRGRGKPKPNNSEENLVTLCRGCHLGEHRQEYLEIIRAKNSKPKLLSSGKWSTKYESYQNCGSKNSPHSSREICNNCYVFRYRTGKLPAQNEMV